MTTKQKHQSQKDGRIDLLDYLEISHTCTSCNLYMRSFVSCYWFLYWIYRGAIFPRVYYSGMPNSLKSGGCQIPCGDAKIPREVYSGMPNSLGYHIPCDTGSYAYGCRCWPGELQASIYIIITSHLELCTRSSNQLCHYQPWLCKLILIVSLYDCARRCGGVVNYCVNIGLAIDIWPHGTVPWGHISMVWQLPDLPDCLLCLWCILNEFMQILMSARRLMVAVLRFVTIPLEATFAHACLDIIDQMIIPPVLVCNQTKRLPRQNNTIQCSSPKTVIFSKKNQLSLDRTPTCHIWHTPGRYSTNWATEAAQLARAEHTYKAI